MIATVRGPFHGLRAAQNPAYRLARRNSFVLLGQRNFDTARECGLLLRKMPCAGAVVIFAALNEGRLDTELGTRRCFHWFQLESPQQR